MDKQANGDDKNEQEYCQYCGVVDREYDENSIANHNAGDKHYCNEMLFEYNLEKKNFAKNRHGIQVMARAESQSLDQTFTSTVEKSAQSKIFIAVKPKQKVKFFFEISSDLKKDTVLILCIELGHPQPQFVMNNHPFKNPSEPQLLEKKSIIKDEVSVTFQADDIGEYEMPIIFTFKKNKTNPDEINKDMFILIVREMVIKVEEQPMQHVYVKSPYTREELTPAENFIPSLNYRPPENFKIPKSHKILLPKALRDDTFEKLPRNMPDQVKNELRKIFYDLRDLFKEEITKANYVKYFHNLLWWEEVVGKINIKRYNMCGVTLTKYRDEYILVVPGLAEKRPSLLRGDSVYLQPQANLDFIFDSKIIDITEDTIHLGCIDERFDGYYCPDALFVVRFIMSRVPMVRSHEALQRLNMSGDFSRVFPKPIRTAIPIRPIKKFYNKSIAQNPEQKLAVEHIVAGSSGLAPYIVFGPPGTGKTVTIIEAIIQLVVANPNNRVMVCTDSNMAADHVALTLLKYRDALNIPNFLLRVNSQTREWTSMPSQLASVSNGTSYNTFKSIDNLGISGYRVVVATLLHAAKYASDGIQSRHKYKVSHLFIDEASQGSEPAALIPVTGLLMSTGQLVLAGDPRQLGPVCVCREASKLGLGTSLLERLYTTKKNLYDNNSTYITKLVNNFRSHMDILQIPNELFYENQLQPLAPLDTLSEVSILGLPGGNRAIVFHSMNSTEQKSGHAPSYFNEKELEMVQRYVKALIETHGVSSEDIGVIAPYIRQVYKIKNWLTEQGYHKVEAGTVEAFQGKEKRVILVSTVRANSRLLDHDAKYSLGFLVDDKRYNVTITRAKSKLIIIGNEACLKRDVKWRLYMDRCREFNTYFGQENEQMNRNSKLLIEVARIRFEKSRMTRVLEEKLGKNKKHR